MISRNSQLSVDNVAVVGRIGNDEVVLSDGNNLELWQLKNNAGFRTIEIDGRGYQFARQATDGDRWWIGMLSAGPDVDPLVACQNALEAVLRSMRENDLSEDKSHPWIPGADAKRIRQIVLDALNVK